MNRPTSETHVRLDSADELSKRLAAARNVDSLVAHFYPALAQRLGGRNYTCTNIAKAFDLSVIAYECADTATRNGTLLITQANTFLAAIMNGCVDEVISLLAKPGPRVSFIGRKPADLIGDLRGATSIGTVQELFCVPFAKAVATHSLSAGQVAVHFGRAAELYRKGPGAPGADGHDVTPVFDNAEPLLKSVIADGDLVAAALAIITKMPRQAA